MVEVQTSRVHRTWLDKLLLWRRAYQTRIFDKDREVFGRGPTPEASQEAAEQRWVAELATDPSSGPFARDPPKKFFVTLVSLGLLGPSFAPALAVDAPAMAAAAPVLTVDVPTTEAKPLRECKAPFGLMAKDAELPQARSPDGAGKPSLTSLGLTVSSTCEGIPSRLESGPFTPKIIVIERGRRIICPAAPAIGGVLARDVWPRQGDQSCAPATTIVRFQLHGFADGG
jgi:hypothetical protein